MTIYDSFCNSTASSKFSAGSNATDLLKIPHQHLCEDIKTAERNQWCNNDCSSLGVTMIRFYRNAD